MAHKKIITKGDPVLGKKCHTVTVFDKKLHALLDDMKNTLKETGGAGLAAPQIGILRRVALVMGENNKVIELINPELIETSGEQDGLEGCLSIPGMWGFVIRPMHATVKAQDRTGNEFTVSGSEIVARCFCHELEHLDGILFETHADRLYTEKELEAVLAEQDEEV